MAIGTDTNPAPQGGAGEDVDSLHDHAVQAEDHIDKLSTGLAHLNADKQTIAVVTKCGEVMRKMAMVLSKAPEGNNTVQEAGQQQEAEQSQPRTTAEATDQMMASRNANS